LPFDCEVNGRKYSLHLGVWIDPYLKVAGACTKKDPASVDEADKQVAAYDKVFKDKILPKAVAGAINPEDTDQLIRIIQDYVWDFLTAPLTKGIGRTI